MLKLKLTQEEYDGLDDGLKEHYRKEGDVFLLDGESVDGLVIENVTALKKTVGTLRREKETAEKALKKYEGIDDPEKARTALSKYEEIANWDGDKKNKESQEALKRELGIQHKKEVDKLSEEKVALENQLRSALVETKIVDALQKEGGNVELLSPHVQKQVQMKHTDNGYIPEVIDEQGNPRIGDAEGNPMKILELVREMKSQPVFAPAFTGSESTGSGKRGDANRGSASHSSSTRVIPASNKAATGSSIDDIASGKVTVDMDR